MTDKKLLYEKGLALENEEKLEEAYEVYKKGAELSDPQAMIGIARLFLTGKFRPVTKSNFADAVFGGGPIFPWSIRSWEEPDYKSGMEWLEKAAALDNTKALFILGNMIASGVGCKADEEKGLKYLEKAAALGDASAKNAICLYRPDGKVLSDEEYENCLAEFVKKADKGDETAFPLYATLKSGTNRQLARLGYQIMAAQNVGRGWDERLTPSYLSSGIPLFPAAAKRVGWQTFLRFDLNAFKEKYPLILVSADILDAHRPRWLLQYFHKAEIVGTAKYTSPEFGWLKEMKEAVVIRLGAGKPLDDQTLASVRQDFYLIDEEYKCDNAAFFVENGEKDYSFEIAAVCDGKVDVLWRYTIGGSNEVRRYFEPALIELTIDK